MKKSLFYNLLHKTTPACRSTTACEGTGLLASSSPQRSGPVAMPAAESLIKQCLVRDGARLYRPRIFCEARYAISQKLRKGTKYHGLALGSLLFLAIFLPSLVLAQVVTEPAPAPDLQKQIQDLLKQIQALQQQVNTLQAELGQGPQTSTPASLPATSAGLPAQAGETTASSGAAVQAPEAAPPELTRSLSRGSSGDDVRKLQEFLAKDKEIYPNGLITGFFGPLTESAVKKWQEKHGIESVGIVGPKTISKLQDIGRGVIQGLLQQGAGASGVIPPGLLKKYETQATPSGAIPAQPIGQTGTTTIPAIPQTQTSTSTLTATTTPSGTIPAVPAQPVGQTGTATVPATSAVPAQPVTTTATTTTTSSDTTAPSVPTNFTAAIASISPDTIKLAWSNSYDSGSGMRGYKVYRNGIFFYSLENALNENPPNATKFDYFDRYLSLGTYTYTIAAYDVAGNLSAQSAPVSATIIVQTINASDKIAPSVPTNLTASSYAEAEFSARVALAWTASTDNVGVIGYEIYVNGVRDIIALLPSYLAYARTSTTYTYTVASYDAAGNVSAQSSHVSVTTPAFGSTVDTTAPSVPTNLTATAVSSTQVNLSWSASTDNTGVAPIYKVYRNGTHFGSTFLLTYSDNNPAATYLRPSTTYTYTVVAYDVAGNLSAQSSHVSVTTPALGSIIDTTAPSVPINLCACFGANPITSTQINLSWSASTDNVGVTGYKVYRNGIQIDSSLTPSKSDTNLSPSTTYTYTVAAYDAAGNVSASSTPVTVTTLSASLANTGACRLRSTVFGGGEYVLNKPGVNTISELKVACLSADYKSLLQQACDANSNFTGAEEVMTRDASGNNGSTSCGQFGCGTRKCLQLLTYDNTVTAGACYLTTGYASSIYYQDPDVGTGYAKKNMEGSYDITSIRSSCTTSIYNSLLSSLCAISPNASGMQESVMIFDAKGSGATYGCANLSGCVSRSCPVATTTSAISSDRDLAAVLRSLSAVLQKLQEALR